jgi:GDP-mannose 6-dehydrogenase
MQIARGLQLIVRGGQKRIGVLGFSFKAGTDDLRESPIIELIERLIGKGYDLRLYDKNVKLASLGGANRDFILNHIPHISRLMAQEMEEVLEFGDTILIGNSDPDFKQVPGRLRSGQRLVDFVRVIEGKSNDGNYDGIGW